MTGPDHYCEAERLITSARTVSFGENCQDFIALAQVHATLALAAATALHTAGVYLTLGTSESWRAAIGAESIKDEAEIVE